MNMIAPRWIFLLFAIGCSGLVLTAAFIEPFKSMDACPMCMMQRVMFLMVAAFALIACLHNPEKLGQRIYALLTTAAAGVGAGVAIRQLWLQQLPEDQVPACGPGLDYMLEVFPLLEVIELALRGSGDCAKVQWTFMSLSIPAWSLVAFSGVTVLSIYILFRKQNTPESAS